MRIIIQNGHIFQIYIQNANNWRLKIKKNKCVVKFNKGAR